MITPAYVVLMARYNAEMNRRMYAAAGRLTEEQRRQDCGAFFGSIHATFSHLLWGDRIWMSRFAGWAKPEVGIPGSVALVEDFALLRAEREQADASISAWAESLEPDWLVGELRWHSVALQRELTRPRAPMVVHMFNHQTHHRGQIHAMITRFGEATRDTDLPFVL